MTDEEGQAAMKTIRNAIKWGRFEDGAARDPEYRRR
jgi:hypothetical protein